MPHFPVSANIVFLYYNDLARAADFYSRVLGLELVVDYDWAKIYQVTSGSFVGCVDGTRGANRPSKDKPVNISFIGEHVDDWYAHLRAAGVTIYRPLDERADIGIRGFMVLDPEGYVLEFEQFLDGDRNGRIRALFHP